MADQERNNNVMTLGPLRLVSVNADDQGDSYFSEVHAAKPPGPDGRADERLFPLNAWQIWETTPGYFRDFKPVAEPQALAIMKGRLEVTVSDGEKRHFSRGDLIFLQDVTGKGHAVRTIGKETASVML